MAAKKAPKAKESLAAWGKDLGDTINAYVKDGIDSLGLATKKDMEVLDKRLKKLEAKKAPARKKKKAPARKKKKAPAKKKKAPAKKKKAPAKKKKAPAKKKAAPAKKKAAAKK